MSSGGEKTEQPTEKRLRDARRKGQVSRSNDLSSALLLVISIAVLGLAGSYMSGKLSEAMRDGVQQAAAFEGVLDRATAFNLLLAATETALYRRGIETKSAPIYKRDPRTSLINRRTSRSRVRVHRALDERHRARA